RHFDGEAELVIAPSFVLSPDRRGSITRAFRYSLVKLPSVSSETPLGGGGVPPAVNQHLHVLPTLRTNPPLRQKQPGIPGCSSLHSPSLPFYPCLSCENCTATNPNGIQPVSNYSQLLPARQVCSAGGDEGIRTPDLCLAKAPLSR